jgi:anti-sigma factor RsiW
MTELSDELLVAYVDGQLAKDQNSAIEKVLKQDAVMARRAAALQEAHERLEYAFDAILAGEVHALAPPDLGAADARNSAIKSAQGTRRAYAAMVFFGTLTAIAGLAGGHYLPPLLRPAQIASAQRPAKVAAAPPPALPSKPVSSPAPAKLRQTVAPMPPAIDRDVAAGLNGLAVAAATEPPPKPQATPAPGGLSGWREAAAQAQALVSRASLEVSLESQKNPYLLAFQLTHAIGVNVRGPDLRPDGYTFIRAQVLQYGKKPMAQMLYLPKTGEPLSLCAMAGGADSEPVFHQQGPVGSVAWTQDGVSYLLAAEASQALLLRIAEKIKYEPLPPPPQPPKKQQAEAAVPEAEPSPPPPQPILP